MPSSHKITMRPAPGVELLEVDFTFGSSFPQPRGRTFREGYGFDIELPAVLDLLTAVDDGVLDARYVKNLLLRAVDHMYEPAGCFRHEDDEDKLAWCRRDGTCRICDRHKDAFAASLTLAAERWRRWTLPEQYPYATGNTKGLHEVGCSVVYRAMPETFSPPSAEDAEALRSYAHRKMGYRFYDRPLADLVPLNYHVQFHAMTAEETRAWMNDNTGPKGGRHYRRCERCAPAP
ncbi:hypothetical protein [Streptomyces sp. BRA346]|uniref:hypothetical protein n=1 Tax=Streptomyces sp. BRA346 TaxID=2878199 RepID=UPI0040633A3B